MDEDEDEPYPVFDKLISSMSSKPSDHTRGIDAELDASGFKSHHQQILAKHVVRDDEASEESEESADENCCSDDGAKET